MKGSVVEDLKLIIDFGPNYSGESGFQEYSLGNGKIKDLHMAKEGEADVLRFTLRTEDFVIFADLAMTFQEVMGLRFVGEIRVQYLNGEIARGVMKIEMDSIL